MEYCLVATADERFWPSEDPIVFLDGGCLGVNQKEQLVGREYIVYNPRWMQTDEFIKASDYVFRLEEQICRALMESLNKIHNVDYDIKSWRVLLLWWLTRYCSSLFYRYETIKDIRTEYSIYTIGADDENAIYVFDTTDAHSLFGSSSLYNGFYSQYICKGLGIEIEKRNISFNRKCNSIVKEKKGLYSFIENIEALLSRKSESIDYNHDVNIGGWNSVRCICKGSLCFEKSINLNIDYTKYAIWDYERKSLLSDFLCQNDFEVFLCNRIRYDFPIAYMEAFDDIRDIGYKHFGENKKIFYSQNAWFVDEVAKSYIAAQRMEGMRLYGIQHGGAAICKYDTCMLDVLCVDRYYTWGWEREQVECEVKRIASPKLSREKYEVIRKIDVLGEGILYVSTSAPRYVYDFNFCYTANISAYINYVFEVLRALEDSSLDVRARLYPKDWGWEFAKRIDALKLENVIIDSKDMPYSNSYMAAELCIYDVLMTSWIEAYNAGKAIVFVVPHCFEYYDEGVLQDIEELRRADVYFNSIDEAIELLQGIDNYSAWWRDAERQRAVNRFASRFSMASEDYKNIWYREICENL